MKKYFLLILHYYPVLKMFVCCAVILKPLLWRCCFHWTMIEPNCLKTNIYPHMTFSLFHRLVQSTFTKPYDISVYAQFVYQVNLPTCWQLVLNIRNTA